MSRTIRYLAAMSDSGGRPLLAVAHRAGNNLTDLRAALDTDVDLVEADIRQFGDELEVRHFQALGPHLLWDTWQLARRRDVMPPSLRALLVAMAGDPRVMLDLKGPAPGMAAQVVALLRELAPAVPVTVCTKDWPMLDAFAGDPHVRLVFSASNHVSLHRLRARLRPYPAFGVSVRRQLLTPAIVAELRCGAEHVMAWPVDTMSALDQVRRLGVTGVTSKNPAVLREVMATRQAAG
jgi:hypothetical protein